MTLPKEALTNLSSVLETIMASCVKQQSEGTFNPPSGRERGKKNNIRLFVPVDKDLLRSFRVACVMHGSPMGRVVREALVRWAASNHLPASPGLSECELEVPNKAL